MAITVKTVPENDETSNTVNEETWLLGQASSSGDGSQTSEEEAHQPKITRRVLIACAALNALSALITISALFQNLPLNQVLESNICAQKHRDGDGGVHCGEDSTVQAELATLRGVQVMVSLIPGEYRDKMPPEVRNSDISSGQVYSSLFRTAFLRTGTDAGQCYACPSLEYS